MNCCFTVNIIIVIVITSSIVMTIITIITIIVITAVVSVEQQHPLGALPRRAREIHFLSFTPSPPIKSFPI